MVFSPNFVEKISRPNLGAKRKNSKKNHTKEHSTKPPTNKLKVYRFVGAMPPTATGTTITLDPTFGSFTLLEPVSH
jgi:hypothetical protein